MTQPHAGHRESRDRQRKEGIDHGVDRLQHLPPGIEEQVVSEVEQRKAGAPQARDAQRDVEDKPVGMEGRRDRGRSDAARVPAEIEDHAHQGDGDAGHDQLAQRVPGRPGPFAANRGAAHDRSTDDDAAQLGEDQNRRSGHEGDHGKPTEVAQPPDHEDEPRRDAEKQRFAAGIVGEGQVEEPVADDDEERHPDRRRGKAESLIERIPAEQPKHRERRDRR